MSLEECERLISFTNNSGPLFISGTVGIGLFGNSTIGILLFLTHILGAISVGILFRFWKKNSYSKKQFNTLSKEENRLQNITISTLGDALSTSISSAISTIFMIGGFVVLFSVIISILNSSGLTHLIIVLSKPLCNTLHIPDTIVSSLFIGILEITNGINLISGIKIKHISINIILSSFLLGIGGLSIMLQVLSILSKSDISIKPYIIGKILHGLFAAFYTYLMIQIFPIFNFNI